MTDDLRELITRLGSENPRRGFRRVHGELRRLGHLWSARTRLRGLPGLLGGWFVLVDQATENGSARRSGDIRWHVVTGGEIAGLMSPRTGPGGWSGRGS